MSWWPARAGGEGEHNTQQHLRSWTAGKGQLQAPGGLMTPKKLSSEMGDH